MLTPHGAGLVLEDINLKIEPGMLVGVVGAVGSSKSSLLMAVLSEISPEKPEGVSPALTLTSAQVSATLVHTGDTLCQTAFLI